MTHSELFKNEHIQVNTDWLTQVRNQEFSDVVFVDEEGRNEMEIEDGNVVPGRHEERMEVDDVVHGQQEEEMEVAVANEGEDYGQREEGQGDGVHVLQEERNEEVEQEKENNEEGTEDGDDDRFIEVDEENDPSCAVIPRDTLQHNPEVYAEELTFAPGEGQTPLSVFHDPNCEFLAFVTIYCGLKTPENQERQRDVHYSDICKWELRSVDRRVAQHIAKMFFMFKKLQMKAVIDKVNFCLRRHKSKGREITVSDMMNLETRDSVARVDEGFFIF